MQQNIKRFIFFPFLSCFPVAPLDFSTMFGKKKKRIEISGPSNFEHRVHTGFDHREQKFTGLPQQWHSLLADTANRPKPMVDPSCITPIQLAPMKVSCNVTFEFPNLPSSVCNRNEVAVLGGRHGWANVQVQRVLQIQIFNTRAARKKCYMSKGLWVSQKSMSHRSCRSCAFMLLGWRGKKKSQVPVDIQNDAPLQH